MLKLMSNNQSPARAPTMASGTVIIMTRGWIKLSNCAASTRNTTKSERPKNTYMAEPDSWYSWACPFQLTRAASGSFSSATFSNQAIASPIGYPGAGVAITVIDRKRSYLLRVPASVISSIVIRLDRGISSPVESDRTYIFVTSVGVRRSSLRP